MKIQRECSFIEMQHGSFQIGLCFLCQVSDVIGRQCVVCIQREPLVQHVPVLVVHDLLADNIGKTIIQMIEHNVNVFCVTGGKKLST